MNAVANTPFALLAEYERLSLAHVAGEPEQIETPGLWRGIGFRVNQRLLASRIDEIDELLPPLPLTSVPGTQRWVRGIANVRGNLVPVVDLGDFLFGTPTRVGDRSRLLVIRQQGSHVGLLVDEIIGQRSLGDEQRSAAEPEDDDSLKRFVDENVNLGGQRIGLFSMSRLARAPDFLQAAL
ncbi:MAG TPA: chemotaxis protein CheW [Rhodanobacteraceae bacterium]